jgi:hypothetical protein
MDGEAADLILAIGVLRFIPRLTTLKVPLRAYNSTLCRTARGTNIVLCGLTFRL